MKAELAHHPPVSVIFDGSTHQGEALAVLVRFVNEEFEIVQRLVRLHVLAKSLSANELARDIITILCTGLRIPASTVICAIRDGASVNGAAMRTMKEVMFPSMMNIIYVLSHPWVMSADIWRHLGASHWLLQLAERHWTIAEAQSGHFYFLLPSPTTPKMQNDTHFLNNFLQRWIALFVHSPATKLLWKTQTSHAIKGYSCTRWWSGLEVLVQLDEHFAIVLPFLSGLEFSPTLRGHLLGVLEDDQEC